MKRIMRSMIVFIILSIPIVIVSRRSLFNIRDHGFYRFFAWECILILIIINIKFWFHDPISLYQVISWILLIFSLILLFSGVSQMSKFGKAQESREEKELYGFEKTTELVDSGIFKYVRHPMYSSLLFLAWGTFFKNITTVTLILASVSTIFLFLTALMDEKECLSFFGEKYRSYMSRSKRFIPFLI